MKRMLLISAMLAVCLAGAAASVLALAPAGAARPAASPAGAPDHPDIFAILSGQGPGRRG